MTRPPKVLVADGDRQTAKLVEIALRRAGYDVVCAHDGVDALTQIESGKPDIVVLDATLPRLDGFGVQRRLEANADTAHIPVIMLTPRHVDANVPAGWESAGVPHLPKPFHPGQLAWLVDMAVLPLYLSAEVRDGRGN